MGREGNGLVVVCPYCLFRFFRERIGLRNLPATCNAVVVAVPPRGYARDFWFERLSPAYGELKCSVCGGRPSVLLVIDPGDIRSLLRPWEVVRA